VGTISYDNRNRLVQAEGNRLEYDSRGALAAVSGPGRSTRYIYDVAGRLTAVLRDDTTVASYAYDPLGRRISKMGGGESTRFLWDGFVLLGEEHTRGRDAILFMQDRFLPLSRTVAGKPEHFVVDRRGCAVATLDASAKLTGTFDFDALGRLRNSSQIDSPPP